MLFTWNNEEEEDAFFDAIPEHDVGPVVAEYDDRTSPEDKAEDNEDEINGIDIEESIMSIYLGAIKEQLRKELLTGSSTSTEQQYFQSCRTILAGITKIGAILIKPGSR